MQNSLHEENRHFFVQKFRAEILGRAKKFKFRMSVPLLKNKPKLLFDQFPPLSGTVSYWK